MQTRRAPGARRSPPRAALYEHRGRGIAMPLYGRDAPVVMVQFAPYLTEASG